MHRKEENQIENHTTPMASEIPYKIINEENSSLFMNSILYKGINDGRNLKSEKTQGYAQKPQ